MIKAKKENVLEELSGVEPAVQDAQSAVKGIKRQHLVEIRALANPPIMVKLALESICLLIGEAVTDWKSIKSITMKDNFIGTIVNFNTDDIT